MQQRGSPLGADWSPRLQGVNMAYRPPKGVRPPQLEGKRTGRPKGSVSPPRLLRDMRWVSNHPEEEDKTQGHRICRAWLQENRKGFMAKMCYLEQAYLAQGPKGSAEKGETVLRSPEDGPKDEGTERVEELIERLLREAGEGL
jgi:hypothetical protein